MENNKSNLHTPLLVHTIEGATQKEKDVTRNISLKNIYGSEVNGFNELTNYQKKLDSTFENATKAQQKIENATGNLSKAADLMRQLAFNIGVSTGKTKEVVDAMNDALNKEQKDEEEEYTCDLCYAQYTNEPLCELCQEKCQGCVECQSSDVDIYDCSTKCDNCQSCYHACVQCVNCESCFNHCEHENYCADCYSNCQYNNGCLGCNECNVKYSYPACTKCVICQGCVSCEKFDTGNVCGASNNKYSPCNNCAAFFSTSTECQYRYGVNRCSSDNGTVADSAHVFPGGERHGCSSSWNCDAVWTSSPCSKGYGGGFGSSCTGSWTHSCVNNYVDCTQNYASSICAIGYTFHVWGCSGMYGGCVAGAYDTLHECEKCYVSYQICPGCYSCYSPNDKFQLWDPCIGCHSSCYTCNVTCNGCQNCDMCVACFGTCNSTCNECQSCYSNCTRCVDCQGCNMCVSCNSCQSNNTCAECEKCQSCVGCEKCNSTCYSGCYFKDE